MAKKKKSKRISGAEDAKGFGHNPFAAALGIEPEPAGETEQPNQDKGFAWSGVSKVVLRRERKGRGGKTVTLIQGLDQVPPAEILALSKSLKKSLGVGVSVEGTELVVQGDQRDRLEPLVTKLGVSNVVRSG